MGEKKYKVSFEEILNWSRTFLHFTQVDTLEELKAELKSEGAHNVELVSVAKFMDDFRWYRDEGHRFNVDELTQEHLEWLAERNDYEMRRVSFFVPNLNR